MKLSTILLATTSQAIHLNIHHNDLPSSPASKLSNSKFENRPWLN
jgi:hypothetical protein